MSPQVPVAPPPPPPGTCGGLSFDQLYRLSGDIFRLTLVLAGLAAELPPAQAAPVLGTIRQLDGRITELRRVAEGARAPSVPCPGPPPSLRRCVVEESLGGLDDAIRDATVTALGIGADGAHDHRVAESARRAWETLWSLRTGDGAGTGPVAARPA